MEHRRVRLVAVAAIDPPRRDNADRRLAATHRPRICTGLVCVRRTRRDPSARGAQVERVVLLPRTDCSAGMLRRGEVVRSSVFDVRTFGHRESHIGEDLDALVVDLAHRMDAPVGNRVPGRTGSVMSARSLSEPASTAPAFRARTCAASERVPDTRALISLTDCRTTCALPAEACRAVAIASAMRPFLPRTAMRTCSMAATSPSTTDAGQQLVL